MKKALIGLLVVLASSCTKSQPAENEYPSQVGDIVFDPDLDDPNFKVCDENRVLQYYNFSKGPQYSGEKPAIDKHFTEARETIPGNESGWLTIRFVVNCEGKTGRYRTMGMDANYREKKFKDETVGHFVSLVKAMDGWRIGELEGKQYDYYQYLTFKFESGQLVEIMP